MKGVQCPKIYYRNFSLTKANFFSVFLLVGLLIILIPEFAYAGILDGIGAIFQTALLTVVMNLIGLGIGLWHLIGIILMGASSLILQNIMHLVLAFDYLPANNLAVGTIWLLVRDLANMALIFVLLYIGIGTILNLKVPGGTGKGMSSLLVPFLISAVLIHFTPLITGIVIDVSHIFTKYFFVAAQEGIGGFGSHPMKDLGIPFGIFNDLNDIAGTIIPFMMAIAYSMASSVILIITSILLIVRIVALNLLVALSPFAFLAKIIPSYSKSVYEPWKKQLVEWAMLPVILGFFLWMSVVVLGNNSVCDSLDGGVAVGEVSVFGGEALCKSMGGFMSITILIVGLIVSSKTSAAGANKIINKGNSLAKGAAKWGTQRSAVFAAKGTGAGFGIAGNALGGVGNKLYNAGTNVERRIAGFGENRNAFLRHGSNVAGFVAGGLSGGGAGAALRAAGDVSKGVGKAGRYINHDKSKGITFDGEAYKKDALAPAKRLAGDITDGAVSTPVGGAIAGGLKRGLRAIGAQESANSLQDLTSEDAMEQRANKRNEERIEEERQEVEKWSDDNAMDFLETDPTYGALQSEEKYAKRVAAVMEEAENNPALKARIRQGLEDGSISRQGMLDAGYIADREGYGIKNEDLEFGGVRSANAIRSMMTPDEERRQSTFEYDRVFQASEDKHARAQIGKYQTDYKEYKDDALTTKFATAKDDHERIAIVSRMTKGALNELAQTAPPEVMERLIRTSEGLGIKTEGGQGQNKFNVADVASDALVEANKKNPYSTPLSQEIVDRSLSYNVAKNKAAKVKVQDNSADELKYRVRKGENSKDKVASLTELMMGHDMDSAVNMFNTELDDKGRADIMQELKKNAQVKYGAVGKGRNQKGGFTGRQLEDMLTQQTEASKREVMTGMIPELLKRSESWDYGKLAAMADGGNLAQKAVAYTQIDDKELHDGYGMPSMSKEDARAIEEMTRGAKLNVPVSYGELTEAFSGNPAKLDEAKIKARERKLKQHKEQRTDKRGNLHDSQALSNEIQDSSAGKETNRAEAITTAASSSDRGMLEQIVQMDPNTYDDILASEVGRVSGFENIKGYQDAQQVIYKTIENSSRPQHLQDVEVARSNAGQYETELQKVNSGKELRQLQSRVLQESQRLGGVLAEAERTYRSSGTMRDKIALERASEIREAFYEGLPSTNAYTQNRTRQPISDADRKARTQQNEDLRKDRGYKVDEVLRKKQKAKDEEKRKEDKKARMSNKQAYKKMEDQTASERTPASMDAKQRTSQWNQSAQDPINQARFEMEAKEENNRLEKQYNDYKRVYEKNRNTVDRVNMEKAERELNNYKSNLNIPGI